MTTTDEAVAAKPAPVAAPAIANPAPLGLAAFALSTIVLSTFNAGLLPGEGKAVVFGLALFFGGLAQLLAGMWEFRVGNTFGALAFTSYGAFWLAWLTFELVGKGELLAAAEAAGHSPAEAQTLMYQSVGVFLFAWALFTAYMTVAALRVSNVVLTVFVLLTTTFLLLAIGDFTETTAIVNAGGVVGILTALAAFYGSAAGVINSTFGRTVLPVGPRD
ncbi:MAG: acetate uptake transporter [Micrococcales bacterium]|nr:acetate uptake transporter [Micrococcales bacterium]